MRGDGVRARLLLGRRVRRGALIRSRPPIADAVAELLTERKIGLDAARESVDAAAHARRRQTTKQDILGRIRGFFNVGR